MHKGGNHLKQMSKFFKSQREMLIDSDRNLEYIKIKILNLVDLSDLYEKIPAQTRQS